MAGEDAAVQGRADSSSAKTSPSPANGWDGEGQAADNAIARGGRSVEMKRVLLTGAAGGVGQRLRKLLAPVYPGLRLSDIKTPPDLAANESFVAADLAAIDHV